jgi:hypothetical protein
MSDPRERSSEPLEATEPAPITVQYRSAYGAEPPRRIRLEIPGWAGSSSAHGDGAAAMPWHCQPFVEGSTYGLELVYPYRSECIVRKVDGKIVFEGGLTEERQKEGLSHPFGVFAHAHYGMATALDLLPPPGYSLRLGPHPRFFTDTKGDVPLALPGHLQRFWPNQFFAVFKAPPKGATHVFRPGEPYAQLLVVPTGQTYGVDPMPAELVAAREHEETQVANYRYMFARHIWQSDMGNWFDDVYKQLLRIFRQSGKPAVSAHLQGVENRVVAAKGAIPTPPGEGSA